MLLSATTVDEIISLGVANFMLLIALPSLPWIKRYFNTDYDSSNTKTEEQRFAPQKIALIDIACSVATEQAMSIKAIF